jgi:hypothetical protein
MKEIHDNAIIKRQSDLVFSKIDDEIIMMSIKNGEYYGLDNIGSRIWEIIEKPVTLKEVVEMLKNEFEVTDEQCRSDVIGFLSALINKELVIIE